MGLLLGFDELMWATWTGGMPLVGGCVWAGQASADRRPQVVQRRRKRRPKMVGGKDGAPQVYLGKSTHKDTPVPFHSAGTQDPEDSRVRTIRRLHRSTYPNPRPDGGKPHSTGVTHHQSII